MVTDIIRDTFTYDNENDWGIEKPDPEAEIKRYNVSRKRFTSFIWGVFCTAYARKNLWSGILQFGTPKKNADGTEGYNHYIYSDTDSIKCLHIEQHFNYIENYNKMCERKLRRACECLGLDYEAELLPKTIKGEVKPLGVWDWETKPEDTKEGIIDHCYKYFKTLGAKRYMVFQDGKLSLTVSGVNKKVAIPYLLDKYTIDECFEAFDFGLNIPAVATGKLTHYYIDGTKSGFITDYKGVTVPYKSFGGVYLEPAEYSFDMAQEYIDYLKGYGYLKI